MANVRDTATVLLSTTAPVPTYRRRKARKAPERTDLAVRTIDPRVMRRALALADGDTRRLEFLGDGSVLVHNRPL